MNHPHDVTPVDRPLEGTAGPSQDVFNAARRILQESWYHEQKIEVDGVLLKITSAGGGSRIKVWLAERGPLKLADYRNAAGIWRCEEFHDGAWRSRFLDEFPDILATVIEEREGRNDGRYFSPSEDDDLFPPVPPVPPVRPASVSHYRWAAMQLTADLDPEDGWWILVPTARWNQLADEVVNVQPITPIKINGIPVVSASDLHPDAGPILVAHAKAADTPTPVPITALADEKFREEVDHVLRDALDGNITPNQLELAVSPNRALGLKRGIRRGIKPEEPLDTPIDPHATYMIAGVRITSDPNLPDTYTPGERHPIDVRRRDENE